MGATRVALLWAMAWAGFTATRAAAEITPAGAALEAIMEHQVQGLPRLDDFAVEPWAVMPMALAAPITLAAADPEEDRPGSGRLSRRPKSQSGRPRPGILDIERARILLQSLTVPGWGQARIGRRTAATSFALVEAGVWGSFAAFRIQQHLRRLTYERTAELFAGIDLDGRDEEFRRVVGIYPSSEEYNRLVVRRDAANLYYDKPEDYNRYIEEHELRGADAWAWVSEQSYDRYRSERRLTQKAGLRANTALAVAIANRLVSAIHAARYAGRPSAPSSWNLECVPSGNDPTAFHLGVRARF